MKRTVSAVSAEPRGGLAVEFVGSAFMMLCGLGAATQWLIHPQVSVGFAGTAFAFGLPLAVFGHILSGGTPGYFNPAVSIGLWTAGRVSTAIAASQILAQLCGATVATLLVLSIASGRAGFTLATNGLAASGYGEHSPAGYDLVSAFLIELTLTCILVTVVLVLTAKQEGQHSAPFRIALAVIAINLFSGPVTNGGANPARSTGPALVMGGWALHQLWLFWAAPILGSVLAGGIDRIARRADVITATGSTQPPAPERGKRPKGALA